MTFKNFLIFESHFRNKENTFDTVKHKHFGLLICGLGLLLTACTGTHKNNLLNEEVIGDANLDSVGILKEIFGIPELYVAPSPETKFSFSMSKSEKVVDVEVSPAGMTVASLVESKGSSSIVFWQIGKEKLSERYELEKGIQALDIAWHPNANALFLMGNQGKKHQIWRIERTNGKWICRVLLSSIKTLQRLLVCPRPFITRSDEEYSYYNYRLFFGMDNGDGTFRIVSITENGTKPYQVLGPKATMNAESEEEYSPSMLESKFALPVAFHPAGHQMIWEDKNHSFNVATYNSIYWGETKRMAGSFGRSGSLAPAPNGLGLLQWTEGKATLNWYLLSEGRLKPLLSTELFLRTPTFTPDGRGVVGLTIQNGVHTLNYVPVSIPLSDVTNAWMFTGSSGETKLFSKNDGLLRPNQDDQLYKLYETENYYCGDYDRSSPTRPYLVTTDLFWELFGSAYQGLFIVRERDEAIPEFWNLIHESDRYFKSTSSVWKSVLSTLVAFEQEKGESPEVRLISEEQNSISSVTGEPYAFSDLKPRGHYTSSPEMMKYFKAFRYFTTIYKSNKAAMKEWNTIPPELSAIAEKWIGCYTGFLAPSRAALVWSNLKSEIPGYCKHPSSELFLFPLSWGYDNEVLNTTVYHENWPVDQQIGNPSKFRALPSGLDLAATLGNDFAENLLQSDFQAYPNLKKVIQNLKKNYKEKAGKVNTDLYSQWINALAVQWSKPEQKSNKLWAAKRLQTGLASWATLRHATILVNERTSAECGEGGYEEILMRAPRGYVEPDPATFEALAKLFESAIQFVPKSTSDKPDNSEESDAESKSLYDGIVRRLKDAAKDARDFQAMAQKEVNGENLTNDENEKILYTARMAEHLFLIFNSLSNKEYALSNPDPMSKIADVAGESVYLMAAVGNSMEWDHVVPFYGRHQIVKGSVYSYYEFPSTNLLTDEEWRNLVSQQTLSTWIKPFVTDKKTSDRSETHY